MNTFHSNFALIVLFLFSSTGFAQQTEKTLVKSFNIDKVQEVTLDLDGAVEVRHWNNRLMRVQMTIALENGSVHMLKSLVSAGRYNLVHTDDGEVYTINAPNLAREIKLRGEPLQEKIEYVVFAPENISIRLADDASTSKDSVKDGGSL
ncbi:MAG: hypothetical protein AAFW73_20890 [Bacteroidota bacterium]